MSDFLDGVDTPEKAVEIFRKKFNKYLDWIKYIEGRQAAGVKLSMREKEALKKFYGLKKRIPEC